MADTPLIPPIRIWTLAELAAQPAPDWLVHGIVPSKSVGMVVGASEAGKTFLVSDLAFTVASGEAEWFGNRVRGGRVVYLAAEASYSLRNRWHAWKRLHPEAAPDLYIIPDAVQFMSVTDISAMSGRIAEVAPEGLALLVVDTWSRVTPGGDEDKTKEMGLALNAVDRLRRQFDCAVVLIHHTGHEGKRARGTSSFNQWVDWSALVQNSEGTRTMQCTKMRDAPHFEPLSFRLRPLAPSCVIEPTDPVRALGPNEQRALAALEGCSGPVSATFWKSTAGLPKTSFYRVVDTLVAQGHVRNGGGGYQLVCPMGLEKSPTGLGVESPKSPRSLERDFGTTRNQTENWSEEQERLAIIEEPAA
jgi:KaiC/GvpD/RAD55 family RecA-like ATPase